MTTAKQLLKAAAAANSVDLQALLAENKSTGNITELLGIMSATEHNTMWKSVHSNLIILLREVYSLENGEVVGKEENEGCLCQVEAVCGLALSALSITSPIYTTFFSNAVQILHDVMYMLGDSSRVDSTQDSISRVCELWFKSDMEGKEDVVSHSILFLLQRSVQPKATGSLIKRIYQSREMLSLIDMTDEQSNHVRCFLVECMSLPTYLKLEDGRKFLSYVMGLSPELVEELYAAIKTQLHRSNGEKYGEIIFRAWKNATGDLALRIETVVIQDLMFHAVHAAKPLAEGRNDVGPALRRLLGYLHTQKKHKGVDEMLLRLYGPILWRALKVANPLVRANAAYLMIDAFPLQNPEGSRREIDEMLQKQFDLLADLLKDKDAAVRVHAVQGMIDLLDNSLAVPSLKLVFARVGNLIHDTSDSVRAGFIKLLLYIKDIRGIRFWDIAPLDSLLYRLETDNEKITNMLTQLLLNTYFPQDKPDKYIVRCVFLLEQSRGAARRFYMNLYRHVNMNTLIGFLLQLASSLSKLAEKIVADKEPMADTHIAKKRKTQTKEPIEEEEDDEGEVGWDTDNQSVMEGALDVLAIVFDRVMIAFTTHVDRHVKAREQVTTVLAEALPGLHLAYGHSALAMASLSRIALRMPVDTVEPIRVTSFQKLRDVTVLHTDKMTGPITLISTNDHAKVFSEKDFRPIMSCLCAWGIEGELLAIIEKALRGVSTATDATIPSKPTARGRKSTKIRSNEKEIEPMNAQVALQYLAWIMEDKTSRKAMLQTKHAQLLDNIMMALTRVKDMVVTRLEGNAPLVNDITGPTDPFLALSLDVYGRLQIHCHIGSLKEGEECHVPQSVTDLLDYVQTLIGLMSSTNPSKKGTQHTSGKRKKNEFSQFHPEIFIGPPLFLLVEMVTLGFSDEDFEVKLENLFLSLLKNPVCSKLFVRQAYKVAFQLVEKTGDVNGHMPLVEAVLQTSCTSANTATSQDMIGLRTFVLSALQLYRRKGQLDPLAGIMVQAVTSYEREIEEEDEDVVPKPGKVGRVVVEAARSLKADQSLVEALCTRLNSLAVVDLEDDQSAETEIMAASRGISLLAALLTGTSEQYKLAATRNCLDKMTGTPLLAMTRDNTAEGLTWNTMAQDLLARTNALASRLAA